MYDTYHTAQLQKTQSTLSKKFSTQIRKVLKQVQNILEIKGKDYNNLVTMPENMPFGDKSWSTLLWIKAHRIASVIETGDVTNEALDDSILDLATYSTAYLAWRQLKNDES